MARTRLAVRLFGAALLVAVSSSAWADRKLPVPNPLQDSANANQVSLHWSNVSGETGFLVERRLAGGSFAEIGKTTADATSYKDTLTVDGKYEYRVRAYRSTGANLTYSDYTNLVDVDASTSTTSTSTGGTTTSSSGGTTTTSSSGGTTTTSSSGDTTTSSSGGTTTSSSGGTTTDPACI
jgi:hypothetical protein